MTHLRNDAYARQLQRDPAFCVNPGCGRARKRRADNRGWTGYAGYCSACAERWRVAGRPAEGPPAGLRRHHAEHGQSQAALGALAAWNAGQHAGKVDRLTDYAWLTSFGESREQAAARVGVSAEWARISYDRMLAEQKSATTRGAAA